MSQIGREDFKKEILNTFGSILAISSEIYREIVNKMATKYSLDSDQLAQHILNVLEQDAKDNSVDLDW